MDECKNHNIEPADGADMDAERVDLTCTRCGVTGWVSRDTLARMVHHAVAGGMDAPASCELTDDGEIVLRWE